MSRAALKFALLVLPLCLADMLSLFDLRPDKFAHDRYVYSRKHMKMRKFGLDSSVVGNFTSLDFMAMANEHGYPAEEHIVKTADGYKLRIHRIPGSPSKPKAPGKPVVFFQHGVFASSDTWILMGPDHDLAYMLADIGYDVWLGNARGNTYSRSHVKLSPNHNPKFWQFSYHEIALFDMPASIDYILKETQQPSLIYVGHSMGTSISYVLLSTKPEYNKKVKLVISLAPVAFWHSSPGPFIRLLQYNTAAIKNFVLNAKINEIFPLTAASTHFGKIACRDQSIFQEICVNFIYYTAGYNPHQLNASALPHLFSFFPAGGSVKTLIHYSQNLNTGDFKMYDYGAKENFLRYKQRDAPSYNLSNVVAPVALFYGKGDAISAPGNTIELSKKLSNVVAMESISDTRFSHLDFLFSRNLKELLNNRLIELAENLLKQANIVR
ncbi:lipase 3-like [Copidosoma floridanum]|uniref:lipase 3-like n=1 Tax=Copidosoma floridanum TaxID=29053 RepID=UPI0006C94BDA|nr:lipase 3-like [Copidosoma floridanum]